MSEKKSGQRVFRSKRTNKIDLLPYERDPRIPQLAIADADHGGVLLASFSLQPFAFFDDGQEIHTTSTITLD